MFRRRRARQPAARRRLCDRGNSAGKEGEQPRADLKRPWAAVAKRAGLDEVRIHDLRHTHASVGAAVGLGLPIIGKLLGHAQATPLHATLTSTLIRCAARPIASAVISQQPWAT